MLNQDYLAIESHYKRYSQTETAEDDEDILDPDNALNDMLERSNDQSENSATETFNARSKAVELILSEERPGNSVVLP